jgi:hypothetical protein
MTEKEAREEFEEFMVKCMNEKGMTQEQAFEE